MIKSLFVVVCVLMAVCPSHQSDATVAALANAAKQATTQMLKVVPMAATMCKTGCPQMCNQLNGFCLPITGILNCKNVLVDCNKLCADMCSCIEKCGPQCDVYETNCLKVGVNPVKGAFCPVIGVACDLTCVLQCPMSEMLDVFNNIFANTAIGVQAFISQTVGPVLKGIKAPPAAS